MQMNSELAELSKRWGEECDKPYVCRWAKAPKIDNVEFIRHGEISLGAFITHIRRKREEKTSSLFDGKHLGFYQGRDI